TSPASLEDFMAKVRQPFSRTAVGTAEGVIQHRGDIGTKRLAIELSFQFSANQAQATATLQGGEVCTMVWRHGEPASARIVDQSRDDEPTLTQLGIKPEDLTFSFLFWKPVEERRRETVSGQPCRVIRLRNPHSEAEVMGWFSEKFLFPLRLEWYPDPDANPDRVAEFTRFEKQEDGLWFIKTMLIRGRDWKTKLTLRKANINVAE
ncbi:MAG: hypothetical protein ACOCUY_03700, partial [Verrucomicrobiota bacterium]